MENIEKHIEQVTAKKMADFYKAYGCTFENHWTEHKKKTNPTQLKTEAEGVELDDIIVVHWYGKKQGKTRDFEYGVEMTYQIKDNEIIGNYDKFV